jgi:3',5'-nucleoside bisphosphate phosphatase
MTDSVPGTDSPEGGESFVDLHSHSTASDGACAPTAVVEAAARIGLAALALTDHDTVSGIAEAAAAGDRLGVRVVPGVELSAVHAEREVHLLGLHLEHLERVESDLAIFRASRRVRAETIVARLHAVGVPLALEDVLAEAGGGVIGRPHIARAIVAGGWARDQRDAFDRYLGTGRPAFVPKQRLTASDAIDLIHRGGGLALFAHPASEGNRSRVEGLVRAGLDGLEVRHPSHTADDIARIGALADHFGLARSGGSDWHGAGEGTRVLGAMRVPTAWLTEQESRVQRRRDAIPLG